MRVILITRDLGRIVIWRQSISCLQFVTADTSASASFATVAHWHLGVIKHGANLSIKLDFGKKLPSSGLIFVQPNIWKTFGLSMSVLCLIGMKGSFDHSSMMTNNSALRFAGDCGAGDYFAGCRCHLKLNYNDVGGGGLGGDYHHCCATNTGHQ